ncbi:hypothetical protein Hanom_Chr05g00411951 [Helianthus anomalus]
MNEDYIFLNHVTNEFQLAQMVCERFILNLLVLQKHTRFFFETCMSFMASDGIVLVTIRVWIVQHTKQRDWVVLHTTMGLGDLIYKHQD